jgi:hypothetical protein
MASPLDEPLRFLLHLNGELVVPENSLVSDGIKVYSFGEDVYVCTDGNITGWISVCDLQGREILNQKLKAEPMNKVSVTEHHGIIIAEIKSPAETMRQKVFIK